MESLVTRDKQFLTIFENIKIASDANSTNINKPTSYLFSISMHFYIKTEIVQTFHKIPPKTQHIFSS